MLGLRTRGNTRAGETILLLLEKGPVIPFIVSSDWTFGSRSGGSGFTTLPVSSLARTDVASVSGHQRGVGYGLSSCRAVVASGAPVLHHSTNANHSRLQSRGLHMLEPVCGDSVSGFAL